MKRSTAIFASLAALIAAPITIAAIGAALLPKPAPYAGPGSPAVNVPAKTAPPTPKLPTIPKGWKESPRKGVFWRFCTDADQCVPFTARYGVSLIVWCRDRACGDIYVRANIETKETVVGWTNDTGYGRLGDRVQIDLDTYQSAGDYFQITEMKIRG